MKNRIDSYEISKTVERFYEILGFDPNDENIPFQKRTQARSAIAMAMTRHVTQEEVAFHIGKHRSTLSHYKKHHDGNLECWEGYKEIYETAKFIADTDLASRRVEFKIKDVNRKIKFLMNEKRRLYKRLEEIPKNKQIKIFA